MPEIKAGKPNPSHEYSERDLKIPKLAERICKLFQEVDHDALLYYHKGNVMQAPLEALVSLYLCELFFVFTTWFQDQKHQIVSNPALAIMKLIQKDNPEIESNQVLVFVFVPLFIGIFICVVYTLWISLYTTAKLYKSIYSKEFKCKKHDEKDKNNAELEDVEKYNSYRFLDARMKKVFRTVHTCGTLSYTIVGFSTAVALHRLMDFNIETIPALTGAGFLLGLGWNILGYNGDRMIDWSNIALGLSDMKEEDQLCLRKNKITNYKWRTIMEVIMLGVLMLVPIAGLIAAYVTNTLKLPKDDLQTNYLLISLYAASVVLYARQILSHFYGRKGPAVYLALKDIAKHAKK